MSLTQWILLFAAAAVLVAGAGVEVARSGDELAERAGLSRLFVGMLLVAGVTSLPEVVTDVSAAVGDAPDLAVGDLFGSNMANMAILAVIDLLHRQRVWPNVEIGHARVASVAIALTALAALGVLTPPGISVGWVGIDTLFLATAYVAAVAWMRRSPVSRFGRGELLPRPTGWSEADHPAAPPDDHGPARPLRPVVVRFTLAALVILVAGPLLARSAEGISDESGLGLTFMGTLFVAVTTSLPELVSSIAAVRIGSYDLAVGNLFGSNAFNMAALLVVDLAYTDGPLLPAVHPSQSVAAIGAVLLMALALAAIVHGETRVHRLEPDAVLLLVVYAGCIYAVWTAQP